MWLNEALLRHLLLVARSVLQASRRLLFEPESRSWGRHSGLYLISGRTVPGSFRVLCTEAQQPALSGGDQSGGNLEDRPTPWQAPACNPMKQRSTLVVGGYALGLYRACMVAASHPWHHARSFAHGTFWQTKTPAVELRALPSISVVLPSTERTWGFHDRCDYTDRPKRNQLAACFNSPRRTSETELCKFLISCPCIP